MKKSLVIVFSLLLAGCASMQYSPDFDLRNQQIISSKVTVKYDPFTKQKSVSGPIIRTGNVFSNKSWFLRGFVGDTAEKANVQIYVSVYYNGSDWRFLGSAATNGEFFETTKISRDVISCSGVSGCSYKEDLAINVTLEKLQSLLDANGIVMFGIKDRFGENWVIDLTKEYIEAFESHL